MLKRFYPLFLLCLTGCCDNFEKDAPSPIPTCRELRWTSPCRQETKLVDVETKVKLQGPHDMGRLIDFALKNNPETAMSWAETKKAYFKMKGAQGEYYPEITGEIGFNGFSNSGSKIYGSDPTDLIGDSSSDDFWTETVTLSWLLLDFGGRDGRIEAQKHALIASNWTHNQTLQKVIYQVVQTYYQAIEADSNLKAAKADLEETKALEEASRIHLEAGVGNKIDLLQAEANRWKSELNVQQAIGNKISAYALLSQAVGVDPETKLSLSELPKELQGLEVRESLSSLVQRGKIERDDLQATIEKYLQAGSEVKATRSSLFPQIIAQGKMEQYQLPKKNTSGSSYSGGIALNWKLFNGFSDAYDLYQAKAHQQAAYASLKDREQQVVVDVIQAYAQFETAKDNIVSASEYLKLSEEAFQYSFTSYKAGIGTILDVFNAQSSLSDARFQEIRARSGMLVASANLAYATGTLFQSSSSPFFDIKK